MTRSDVLVKVGQALSTVAPEVDANAIAVDLPLREQVDLDSLDFLRFIVALHQQLGVSVPEADYPKLSTVNAIADYVGARLSPQ
jgi:acyl carrier protein